MAGPVLQPDHPGSVGRVSEAGRPEIGRGAPPPLPDQRAGGNRDWPGRVPGTDPAGRGAGPPGGGVSSLVGAWRTNEQSGADGGGACARVRRAAGRWTQAEAGVARTAGRCRAELAAGLAAALACQAVARLRPRAPPSRSAPSHRPVRARAEAAVRRSRSSGSAAAAAATAAWRRVPGERRRRRRGVLRPGGASTCRGPPAGAR